MNITTIGILFIVTGLAYGSLASDKINFLTIGYLLKNGWVKQPKEAQSEKELLGSKLQIIIFAILLNVIGIYILWHRNF